MARYCRIGKDRYRPTGETVARYCRIGKDRYRPSGETVARYCRIGKDRYRPTGETVARYRRIGKGKNRPSGETLARYSKSRIRHREFVDSNPSPGSNLHLSCTVAADQVTLLQRVKLHSYGGQSCTFMAESVSVLR